MISFRQLAPTLNTAKFGAYYRLMKPTVMQLVIFTALTSMILAGMPPESPGILMRLLCLALIALGAGAAGAINMGYERDIDARMYRTHQRPTVSGEITKTQAIVFGSITAGIAVIALTFLANIWAGATLAFTILFYAVYYTMYLKQRSPYNIVIGGAAGALPPVVAWLSVVPEFHPLPWIMFLIIFLWTPPHFWALSLYCSEDYKRSGLPMLVITHGADVTRKQILRYSIFLGLSILLPFALGYLSVLYFGIAFLYHSYFQYLIVRLYRKKTIRAARDVFRQSIMYLFVIFLAMAIDYIVFNT